MVVFIHMSGDMSEEMTSAHRVLSLTGFRFYGFVTLETK